jgi:peptide/nickel transport system permease protein
MARFLLQRFLILLIALFAAHFAGYAYAYPGGNPFIPVQGPVEPLLPMYAAYMQQLFGEGTLGTFPGSSENVGARLAMSLTASLGLLAAATVLSIIAGMALGILAARSNPPGVAGWMAPFTTFGLAMPSFYLGSLLIVGGIYYAIIGGPQAQIPLPLQGFGWDSHLVLPVLVLMFRPTVQIAQVTADLVAGELGKQYVTAARSLGYDERRIRLKLALRNAIVPVLVTIANSFRLMIGELIVVEFLFAWPGLGRLLVLILIPERSVLAFGAGSYLFNHPPLVAAIAAIFAALFLLGNLLASGLSRSLDPRLRES